MANPSSAFSLWPTPCQDCLLAAAPAIYILNVHQFFHQPPKIFLSICPVERCPTAPADWLNIKTSSRLIKGKSFPHSPQVLPSPMISHHHHLLNLVLCWSKKGFLNLLKEEVTQRWDCVSLEAGAGHLNQVWLVPRPPVVDQGLLSWSVLVWEEPLTDKVKKGLQMGVWIL